MSPNPAVLTWPRPVAAGFDVPFDVSLVATAQNDSDLTTYTFSGLAFGDAAADRSLIVVITGRAISSRVVTGVTIGGSAATLDMAPTLANGTVSYANCAIARVALAAGTTGDVVVTFASAQLHCLVAVYRVTGGTPAVVATDTKAIQTNVGSFSLSAASSAGGFGLASGYIKSGVSWTGATEDYEIKRTGTTDSMGGASADTTAGTFTPTATFPFGTVAAFAITYGKA